MTIPNCTCTDDVTAPLCPACEKSFEASASGLTPIMLERAASNLREVEAVTRILYRRNPFMLSTNVPGRAGPMLSAYSFEQAKEYGLTGKLEKDAVAVIAALNEVRRKAAGHASTTNA